MKKLYWVLWLVGVLLYFQHNNLLADQITDSMRREVEQRIALTNQIIKEKGYSWKAGITSLSYFSNEKFASLYGVIANHLNVSKKTVAAHRENIKKKLGVKGIAGITRYVIRENLTTL